LAAAATGTGADAGADNDVASAGVSAEAAERSGAERIGEKSKKEADVPPRLVAFGRYAGIAGAFDFFRGIGEFMLQKKLQTPFIFLGSTYMYEDYDMMKQALANTAKNIAKSGTPKAYEPMVFAVTGTGRVA
jgi:hypothetical protein